MGRVHSVYVCVCVCVCYLIRVLRDKQAWTQPNEHRTGMDTISSLHRTSNNCPGRHCALRFVAPSNRMEDLFAPSPLPLRNRDIVKTSSPQELDNTLTHSEPCMVKAVMRSPSSSPTFSALSSDSNQSLLNATMSRTCES